jgi:glucose-6-phosphate isomerase
MIKIDLSNVDKTYAARVSEYVGVVSDINMKLHSGQLHGDWTGWLDLPNTIHEEQIARLEATAKRVRENSDVLLVIGIGGSYLGGAAAIEMLNGYFKEQDMEVIFVGQNISSQYIAELKRYIADKDFSINVISKSGTTLEPALAFRIFKEMAEERYGDASVERIIATTDPVDGALRSLSSIMGYETYVIPKNVGGRYSVLTPVGLLPMAVAGINIRRVIAGAKEAFVDTSRALESNPAYQYAVIRDIYYNVGKKIEIIAGYEPKLRMFFEWQKQLFMESEGKDGKGLFLASCNFSTDLHSLGQFIQDGPRHMIETVFNLTEVAEDVNVLSDERNLDGLNYLVGKTVSEVNKNAFLGTLQAHVDGGIPNIILNMPDVDDKMFGYMVYFFMKSCAMSSELLGVNPFNQPGVEDYKRNMFALLGKNK